MFELLECSN